jgi:hypothetical protein
MAVLNYTPQSGVLPVDQELTLANLAQRLSGPENALMTRGIGGILGMAQMARDYDYPDTALGLLSLPAKAVTGLGAAMMQAPAEMIDSANEQVAGLNDGSEVTEGALSMLGMGGVLGSMPRGALASGIARRDLPKQISNQFSGRTDAELDRDKFADEVAMRDLERRVYDLTNSGDFIDAAKQSGNKVSTPFTVGGPKMTVDDIQAMESSLKFDPASAGYYDKKIFSPEDFEIGATIVPNPGDPTIGGRLLESASGPSKIINTSGTDFMRQHPELAGDPAIWASGDAVMNKLQKRVLTAKENPAYFVSAEQGPKSVPFNSVIGQRYEELLDTSKVSKKGADEVDVILNHRQVSKDGTVAAEAPWQKNIPRVDDPRFADWLHSLPGTSKSEIVLRLNKGKVIDEGMPDVREIIRSFVGADSAWAIDKGKAMENLASNKLVNGLIGDPLVGKSIARVSPGAPLRPSSNQSFPTETTGEYVGGFGFRPRRSEVFRDWYADNNLINRPDNAAHRGFSLSYPTQVVDAEWQDTLMKLREAAIRQK